jgi:hypothetical protein
MMDMSNLQIGLAIGGVLLVLAIALQGAWTSRKNLPRQATKGAEQEPSLGDTDPELDAAAFDVANFPVPVIDKKSSLDALIDSMAPITPEGEVSGDAALAAMPASRRAGSKPLAIEGYNQSLQRWEKPVAGQRYLDFQAGVQLANRSGALNEIEYSEFVMKTQAFCDSINATPEFPEMSEEVARARELDQFAADHDAQLGFVLRSNNTAWSPGYVQQNAARLGFVAGAIPGRMVIPSHAPGLPAVLSLSFDAQAALAEDLDLSAIWEVAVSFDVPQVDRTEQAFARMREAMQTLAEQMDGEVTDDNGVKVTREAMDAIAVDLEHLYDTLDQRDLSAGSPLARRLFS